LTEPVRLINYISVNIAPSREDVLAGQKKVEDAILALNQQPDLQGISEMPEFVVDRQNLTSANIENQASLKAALDSMSVGRAALVSRNGYNYNIAKLLGKSVQSDKAVLDFMAVQGTRAQIDSLTSLLNGGASFDSIAQSPLVAQSQKAMDVSLIDANAAMVKELIEGRATGVYFAPDTLAQGGRIVRIAELATPTTVYDVANITFTTEPSNSTVNSLENSLQDYVATHKTAKAFADSAQAGGYTVFPAYITPSTPMIGNLSDSHSAVAWVIDASKGDVSPVFGDLQTGHFIAVALDDIYDGYTPARDPQLNAELSRRVLNNKKAAKLIAEYQGKAKDIPAYANLMGDQVDTTTVNFSQSFIPGIGFGESEIIGRVAAAKAGDIVGPVQGNNAVIVFQVTGIDNQGRPYDFNESAARYEQQRGASRMANNLPAILRGNKKVKNNITTFYK
ncbi:MAG: peptidyl-prolyl cis-trans isomerase, partial [Duncaniella sp.]|nr:peptidyl-prolyl cis-trans isomerase [Duncaniella sp.]